MVSPSLRSDSRYEFSDRVRNILCLKSGRRCAFTGCNQDLYQDGSIVGIFAHIYPASSKGGPRFDPDYPKDLLDKEDNGLLLCTKHHKIVDDHPDKHTVESLKTMKEKHERFVKQQMIQDMSNVGFPEIEILLKHLKSSPTTSNSVDWTLVGMDQKINKNRFSEPTREFLKLGILKVQEVKRFIESMDLTSPNYSENLRQIFVNRYVDLRKTEPEPDSLFYRLLISIEGDASDLGSHAAALAILTYLFERCEVFEK